MPSRVVLSIAINQHLLVSVMQFYQTVESLPHFVFLPNDADQVLHHRLQVLVDRKRIFGAIRSVSKWRERPVCRLVDLLLVIRAQGILLGKFGCMPPRSPTEDKQVRKRISSQSIGAMQTGGGFARG